MVAESVLTETNSLTSHHSLLQLVEEGSIDLVYHTVFQKYTSKNRSSNRPIHWVRLSTVHHRGRKFSGRQYYGKITVTQKPGKMLKIHTLSAGGRSTYAAELHIGVHVPADTPFFSRAFLLFDRRPGLDQVLPAKTTFRPGAFFLFVRVPRESGQKGHFDQELFSFSQGGPGRDLVFGQKGRFPRVEFSFLCRNCSISVKKDISSWSNCPF